MKHLRPFNENTSELSKEELLENKIRDMISYKVDITNVPYGDWCSECSRGQQEIDSNSIDLAAKDIVKFLKEQGFQIK